MYSRHATDRSRGQILLVTAVILALLFVGFIGTLYVGASTADERATGPHDYTSEAQNGVQTATYAMEDALLTANTDRTLTSQSDRETAATESVRAAATNLDAAGRFDGRIINVSLEDYSGTATPAGTRVVQNAEGNLSSNTGSGNWTVISGAEQTRQASVRVDPLSLPTNASEATNITLVGDTTETVGILRTGSNVTLAHSNGRCNVGEIGLGIDNPRATADLIGGRLTLTTDGTTYGGSCTGYTPPENVERIEIENGNQTTGTLGVVSLGTAVQGTNVTSTTTPPAAGAASEPTAHHVVYAVPVELTVATERTTTRRLVVVAPGTNEMPS